LQRGSSFGTRLGDDFADVGHASEYAQAERDFTVAQSFVENAPKQVYNYELKT
jgi:hypothetical protein